MSQNRIDQLLSRTSGQHGFWLINHVEYIRKDLEFLLKWHGGNVIAASAHLNDLESDFVKDLYIKIKDAREAA